MRLDLPANSALTQWRFEIFCAVVTVWMLVAMCIVLYMFDSESAFDGPVVTLNAIISMLSTASRVSLVAMLASAISQWNWLLFSESNRRLLDFQHLAEASRGPLGSVKVLLDSHIVGGCDFRGVLTNDHLLMAMQVDCAGRRLCHGLDDRSRSLCTATRSNQRRVEVVRARRFIASVDPDSFRI